MRKRLIVRIEHWTLDWDNRVAVSEIGQGPLPILTRFEEAIEGFETFPVRSPHWAAARGAVMNVYGPTFDEIHWGPSRVNRKT